MTADAKVGLLLGLFFIVIIAFLVNGLPPYIQQKNTTPPSATIITPSGQDMGLGSSIPEVAHRLYEPRATAGQRTTAPPQEMLVQDPSPEQPLQVEIPNLVPTQPTPVVVVNTPPALTPTQITPEAPKAKTHVVESGEILPVIAKHYYGPEEGNRRIVIQKLYEANSSVLKSPDHVCVGQKLTIPQLTELLRTDEVVKAPSATKGVIEKISDLFVPVEKKDIRSISEYTVREGDSLWAIAQQSLGDGNRYKEIAKLNKGKIKSVNDVPVGTRLKLPTQ